MKKDFRALESVFRQFSSQIKQNDRKKLILGCFLSTTFHSHLAIRRKALMQTHGRGLWQVGGPSSHPCAQAWQSGILK